MDCHAIMQLALRAAGFQNAPEDSGVYVNSRSVRHVLFSIDVDTSDLLLAKEIGCDTVLAHHPLGDAMVNFHRVLERHYELMVGYGVANKAARLATQRLKERIAPANHASNYSHVVSAAKALGLGLANIHLPLDEMGRKIVLNQIDKSKPRKVRDLVKTLSSLPEFEEAATRVELRLGSLDSSVGRLAVVLAAGTNGGYPVAKAYYENGFDTIIYMHISPEDLKALVQEKMKGNLIILGHVAGDSLGINPFIRLVQEQGIRVTPLGIVGVS